MEGTVKFFNRMKGFGFIQGDDGKDYFVHSTGIAEGGFLRDNDRVSFNPAQGDRGLKAEGVKLLEKGSERVKKEEDSAAEEEDHSEDEDSDDEEEEKEE